MPPPDFLGPEARKERATLWRDIRAALEQEARPAQTAASAEAGQESDRDALADAVRRASPKARAVIKALLKELD